MEPPTSSELHVKSHGSNQSSPQKALVPNEVIEAERLGEGAICRTTEPGGRPDKAKVNDNRNRRGPRRRVVVE